jgi:hypothetical protein
MRSHGHFIRQPSRSNNSITLNFDYWDVYIAERLPLIKPMCIRLLWRLPCASTAMRNNVLSLLLWRLPCATAAMRNNVLSLET